MMYAAGAASFICNMAIFAITGKLPALNIWVALIVSFIYFINITFEEIEK